MKYSYIRKYFLIILFDAACVTGLKGLKEAGEFFNKTFK